MKTLGVLGGMGPAATVAFMARVQALTPAEGDEDHIRMIVDLNPQVPHRHTRAVEAGETLGGMAATLRDAGAEILCMPCNTAHAHADAIRAAGLPFIDMVAETAASASSDGARRIGVLATPGGEALYATTLEALGCDIVRLEGEDRAAFMEAVFAVKRGDVGEGPRTAMRRLAAGLVSNGSEAVIGGCTEVPLLLAQGDVSVPFTDSAEVLAIRCVKLCR